MEDGVYGSNLTTHGGILELPPTYSAEPTQTHSSYESAMTAAIV